MRTRVRVSGQSGDSITERQSPLALAISWRIASEEIPCRCIGAIHRKEASGMLDLAILGLLHESTMHGYELRKQLTAKLGAIRAAISYGSLYPTLRRLQASGLITEEVPAKAA